LFFFMKQGAPEISPTANLDISRIF